MHPTLPPAGPYSIVDIDVDGDFDTTVSSDSGHDAWWVVARRRGVPQAVIETTRDDAVADLTAARNIAGAVPLEEITDDDLPFATVVVCSIVSRIADLRRCLTQLDDLIYPRVELLIVDNRPVLPADDELPAILAEHPRVRLVRCATPGLSAARNAGIRAAAGEIIAFTDDDTLVDREWLRAIGRRFVAEPSLDVVTGLILPAELETPAQVYFERYYGGFAGVRSYQRLTATAGRMLPARSRISITDDSGALVRRIAIYGVGALGAGASMAFRRSALVRARGFDETLGLGTASKGGEDLAMFMRLLWAGSSMGYEPAAVIFHKHRVEYDELTTQMRYYGLGYTATLTALIWRDPRHLLGLAAQTGPAVRSFVRGSVQRVKGVTGGDAAADDGEGPRYPSELWRLELSGLPRGPFAYFSSLRALRRRHRMSVAKP